jgi:hypothetical protein
VKLRLDGVGHCVVGFRYLDESGASTGIAHLNGHGQGIPPLDHGTVGLSLSTRVLMGVNYLHCAAHVHKFSLAMADRAKKAEAGAEAGAEP